jgi:hypothetical protein
MLSDSLFPLPAVAFERRLFDVGLEGSPFYRISAPCANKNDTREIKKSPLPPSKRVAGVRAEKGDPLGAST